MSSEEPLVSPSSPSVPGATSGPVSATREAGPQVQLWILILGLALAGGLAAWLLGEGTLDLFKPSEKAAADPYKFLALNAQMARAGAMNGAIAFGSLGGLLGLAMGAAGGLARRSGFDAVLGAITGLLVGSLVCALCAIILLPLQWNHRNDDPSATNLLPSLLFHLGLWGGAGLSAGLAFGIGRFGDRSMRLLETSLAGLAGAMVGTFVFEVLGALLFPTAFTALPFSATPETRLLARECVAVFVGLGVIRALPRVSQPARPKHA